MKCVTCKEPMVVLELDQIEVDYCLDCGGIWLDAGELELLLEDPEEVKQVLDKPAQLREYGRSRHKCPICLKRMEELKIGDTTKVHIDHCQQGHGVWFDRGELKEIIEIMGGSANEKVAGLLQDIFGEKKSQ